MSLIIGGKNDIPYLTFTVAFIQYKPNWNNMRTSIFFNCSKFSSESALHKKSPNLPVKYDKELLLLLFVC
jgi:hypothetical protein